MTPEVQKPLRIFCSYSRKDEEFLNELRTWLRPLERDGFIEWWHDRKIVPGWEWEEAIDNYLRTADVILLLVSSAFMASDYVYQKEISRAVERHEKGEARVIPIIIRPTHWNRAPFGKLQALPKDAKPITRWEDKDDAWFDVVEGLQEAIEELLYERQERAAKERYRKAVEEVWTDDNIDDAEAQQLGALASALGLSAHTAADIERDILVDTKEAILERQEQAAREKERHESEEHNADSEAMQRLERSDHTFSQAELEELRALLGLYGRKIEQRLPPGKATTGYVRERMQHWKLKRDQPARSIERTVAERAYSRYGTIYSELVDAELVAKKSLSIGIDFGTANSSMAWFAPESGLAEILYNAEGENKTPSIVYFGEEETLVGRYVEDLLEDVEDITDPEKRDDISKRIVRGIKRNLLSPPIIPIPGQRMVRPVEVVAHILGKLKDDAEQEHFNQEVERVVVTCPTTFDMQRRQVLLEGAALAGFRRVELLDEPIAVALALTKQGQDFGKGLLIYDLGAQMFKLSALARETEDSPYQVLKEPQVDPYFGADDLDLALYDYCDAIAMKDLGRHICLTEGGIDLAFLRQCRSRKENLSKRTTAIFSSYLLSQNGPQRFRHKVHRETLENLIRPRIEGTVKMTVELWEQVKDNVDAVILLGGASRIPLVRQRLEQALPVKVRTFDEWDLAVAQGAAHKAYELLLEEARHHHG